jgi:nitrogen fixation NifU-like protein
MERFHFLPYIRLLEGGGGGFIFFLHLCCGSSLVDHRAGRDGYNSNGMYSAQVLDHFQSPRNAGDVVGADAVAEIENPACGDVLRLSLKINSGRIAEIRFKAKGCVASMACASALTELVEDHTLAEARSLRRESLIAAVGGLPQASTHAAQLALDTLSAALRQIEP